MHVALLGPAAVIVASRSVAVPGARLRGLLARLALDAGRPVPARDLAVDLWDGGGSTDSGGAVQSLVSRLRRTLGDPDLVVADPAGYRLAIDPDAVDAICFERLAAAGRAALADGRPAEAADLLASALALWRGPALVDVRDAPFAAPAADRLEQRRLATSEDRAAALLALGRPAEVVEELVVLAREHPLRETLHAQLLRALAATGRTAEALAHYEHVRGLLADALGADPSPALRDVHAELLRGDAPVAPIAPVASVAPASPPPVRRTGNLPTLLTSFVGRADDVASVAGELAAARLVTLVGPGGAGKTRLAVEVGHAVADRAPDGVWLVPLAPLTAADDVPRAVLAALDRRERALFEQGAALRAADAGASVQPLPELLDRLVETLAYRRAVLVVDNCEHVAGAAARVTEFLLQHCPDLRILATSREPLHVDGERLRPVPTLSEEAAAWLFADRARAVEPGFALDADTSGPVAEICRRLDGLPLAIELAAARLRTLPVAQIAARLDDRFRLLTVGSRTVLPRHRTLRAVVAWSFDLLTDAERELAEHLAVLPGPFTAHAAAAVGGLVDDEGADLLAALVDKSLVQVAGVDADGDVRHRMLETIREYGLERLTGRGVLIEARRRAGRYALALAQQAEPHLRQADQLVWLERVLTELPLLRATMRWGVDEGTPEGDELAVRVAAALAWYWAVRASFDEAITWLDVVVPRAEGLTGDAPAIVESIYALSGTASGRGLREGTVDRLVARLDRLDVADAHPLLVLAGPVLAALSGDPGAAQSMATLHADHSDPWLRSALLLLAGTFAENAGEVEYAMAVLPDAVAGFQALGDRWGLATAYTSYGQLLPLLGRVDEALAAFDEAARLSRELGAHEDAAQLELRAITLTEDPSQARRRIAEIAQRPGAADSAWARTTIELSLAELDLREGDLVSAGRRAQLAASVVGELVGAPPQVPTLVASVLARVDAAAGRLDEAEAHLRIPAVTSVLAWDMPVAARLTTTAAIVSLAREDAERAAHLLGLAVALRGVEDPTNPEAVQAERAARRALGDARFDAVRSAGASRTRSQARDDVADALGIDRVDGRPLLN